MRTGLIVFPRFDFSGNELANGLIAILFFLIKGNGQLCYFQGHLE